MPSQDPDSPRGESPRTVTAVLPQVSLLTRSNAIPPEEVEAQRQAAAERRAAAGMNPSS